jgi:hypothetical protein
MTSMPLLTQANLHDPDVTTQIDLPDNSSLNHALTTVAQEVVELLQQAYPVQAYPVQEQTKSLSLNHDNQYIEE